MFALVTYPMFFLYRIHWLGPLNTPKKRLQPQRQKKQLRLLPETGAEVARYELESLPAKRQVDRQPLAPGFVVRVDTSFSNVGLEIYPPWN